MGLSDCSEAYMLVLRPSAFPSRTDGETHRQSFSELSRLPHMELMHMPQVSDSGEPNEHSLSALTHIAFPIVLQGRHSRTVISEVNTAPMHTPANASPRHHWSSRHSSGPERIATPYSVVDFHHLLHAGFCRRFQDVPLFYGRSFLLFLEELLS